MRKVETKFGTWSSYSNIYIFEVPSYSKLLDVNLVNNQLVIIYEYDDIISTGNKNFNFYVKDNDFLYPPYLHEYFKSIKVSELQRINTISTGTGLDINLTPPFESIFYVFFQDQKSLDETRDEKLNEVFAEVN